MIPWYWLVISIVVSIVVVFGWAIVASGDREDEIDEMMEQLERERGRK